MELLEFVVQGVRGFPELTRIPLSSGLTLLSPSDERGAVLARVLLSLLYPKGSEPDLADLILEGATQPRVGITLQGRDGAVYRILEDAATGRRSLLKQENGQQVALSKTSAEIAQAVTAVLGFPQEDVLSGVFITRREDLPSQRRARPSLAATLGKASGKQPAAPAGFSNKPLPPGFEGSGVVERNTGAEDAQRARLAEIDQQLGQMDRVRKLEFDLDGMQKLGFEIDQRMAPFGQAARNVEKARDLLARFSQYEMVPPDLAQQHAEVEAQTAQHERELLRLDEDKRRLVQQLGYDPETENSARRRRKAAYWQLMFDDPLVKYGLLAGACAIIVGLLGGALNVNAMRWVALLDIPALGTALVGAWRWLSDYESTVGMRSTLERLIAERGREVSRFELDTSGFRLMLQRFNLTMEQLPDVEAALEERAKALQTLAEADQALADAGGAEALQALEQEKAQQVAGMKALEEELSALGAFLGSQRELEEERDEIRRALRGDTGPAPARESNDGYLGAGDDDEGLARDPVPSAVSTEDVCQELLKLAADLLMVPLEIAVEQLKPRISQYLAGLTDRRYTGMSCPPTGAFSAVEAASGQPIAYAALTPGDRDLAYLAVKLTVIEQASKTTRIPVIIDGAFEGFPEPKEPLLVRMLQYLSSLTQVLCTTSKTALLLASPNQVKLP